MSAPIGLLCPFLFLALFIGVIIFVIRTLSGRSGLTGPGAGVSGLNVMTQIADDGFWILSSPGPISSIVHFHYWADGVRHTGEVPCQPGADGRQFVYTGLRPDQVVIFRIAGAMGAAGAVLIPPMIEVDSPVSSPIFVDPRPSAPSSFPPAY